MKRQVRTLLRLSGVACFGLGAIGVFVPGLPTTVFVLVGSYLLTRSAPQLEARLRSHRLFRSCAPYLDPSMPLAFRTRMTALACMWISIGTSALVTRHAGVGGARLLAALTVAGVVGTVVLLRFRRERRLVPARS